MEDLEFTQARYEVSINETSIDLLPLEPSFLTVLCNYSIDDSNNSNTTEDNTEIMYTLMVEDDIPFAINLTTGELSIIDDLDYESVTQYNLTAVCTVASNLNVSDTASVTVNLLPVNEHRPSIQAIDMHTIINELSTPGLLHNTLPGRAYIVSDMDQPPGNIYYTLSDGTYDNLGIIFNETLNGIVLMEPYDRENQNNTDCNVIQQLLFRVTVCDISPPDENCPNILLTVSFFPTNDNTPKFSQGEYKTALPENLEVNTTLNITVTCTDEDICEGELSGMNITDPDMATMFSIDNNGNIVTLQTLDFEDTKSYTLNVSCFDRAVPSVQRTAFTIVHINITDENDNPPICSQPETVNLETGKHDFISLLRLSCTDEDEGINSQLTFKVDGQLPQIPKGQFRLDEATGELQFSGELAAAGDYDFRVVVSDSGASALTTIVLVTVKVTMASVTDKILPRAAAVPMLMIIVVCVVGGLLLLCCLFTTCCCCYCLCCRKKRTQRKLYVAHLYI